MNRIGRRFRIPVAGLAPVRLGVAWFGIQMIALQLGLAWLTALYAALAALAAFQAASTWRMLRVADCVVAGAVAGSLTAVGLVETRLLGAVVLVGVVVSLLVLRLGRTWRAALGLVHPMLPSWIVPGLACAAVVVVGRYELGAAVVLIWLLGAFDAGHHLISADGASASRSIVAGVFAAGVAMFTAVTLAIPPLASVGAVRLGALALVALPAGLWVGRLLVPAGSSSAPGLLRLDSALVLAPAWAWAIGLAVADGPLFA